MRMQVRISSISDSRSSSSIRSNSISSCCSRSDRSNDEDAVNLSISVIERLCISVIIE